MNLTVEDARDQLDSLIDAVARGERVVLTRGGAPAAEIVPSRGVNWEALRAYKRAHGIDRLFGDIPDNFDDPLPEDILSRPLP